MPTAGILVIGNEILSGKVVDTNSPYLCEQLRGLGVDVERIFTIPDEIDVIAEHVKYLSDQYDFVFTSGGIGPTHDDLTIDGIARAFERKIITSDSIMERLRQSRKDEPNESEMKMAQIPEGSSLLDSGDLWFPLVVVENVYIFPGIPELLRKKFDSARDRFRGIPFVLRRVFVRSMELHGLLGDFPELHLGSYPKIQEEAYRVLLTLESRDEGYVQRALDSLLERLPDSAIHKVE